MTAVSYTHLDVYKRQVLSWRLYLIYGGIFLNSTKAITKRLFIYHIHEYECWLSDMEESGWRLYEIKSRKQLIFKMCIRDSGDGGAGRTRDFLGDGSPDDSVGGWKPILRDGIHGRPKSPAHGISCGRGACDPGGDQGVQPVSYTHLDVYKRQS